MMAKVYPKRRCLYEDCPNIWFIPRRANQLHCDGCKDAKNNAKKRKEAAELFPNEKQLKQNTKRLKALFESNLYPSGVPEIIIRHEQIQLTLFTDKGENPKTKAPVLWSFNYGIELIADTPYKLFKIHKR